MEPVEQGRLGLLLTKAKVCASLVSVDLSFPEI